VQRSPPGTAVAVEWTLNCQLKDMIAATPSTQTLPVVDSTLPDTFDIPHQCLDMFPIKWLASGRQCSDNGILLEIWRRGGLLQTSEPIPAGSTVLLALTGRAIQAQVACCKQDEYGFLVHVSVDPKDGWFPQSYCPPYRECFEPQGLAS
jgi:hypothetical protein